MNFVGSLKVLLAAGAFAAAACAAGLAFWRRPLPKTRGRIKLPFLKAPVEVVRDIWGVPHIYAQNMADLLAAQGFVHAQDRMWQMELNRRIATGALSEIFGRRTLEVDRFMRIVGFHRAAKEEEMLLGEDERPLLEAYCRGVNAFIRSNRRKLPLELTLLRASPKEWTVADCLAWAKLMGWGISLNWDGELVRSRFAGLVGESLASLLEPEYGPEMPVITPPGAPSGAEHRKPSTNTFSPPLGGASNSWVVDGSKSVTGKPILANDPHLAPQLPSPWYEAHLSAGDMEVVGASIPGLPGITIGRNRHITWGITASMVDVQDLYIEEMRPSEPGKYRHGEEWLECTVVREEIRVRGEPSPVTEDVTITVHGPILTPCLIGETRPLALRSTLLDPHHMLRGNVLLNKASNWEEFREAVRFWGVPSVCFVYADVNGNIGYQLGGSLPARKKGDGKTPAPGWDPEYDWDGVIPFEEVPYLLNPEGHFIATANNKIWDGDHPKIFGEWADGYRAGRIQELLNSKENCSPQDFSLFHMDTVSSPAREITQMLSDLSPKGYLQQAALEMIKEWDGSLSPDSGAAAVYQAFRLSLMRRLLSGRIGPAYEEYFGSVVHPLGYSSIYLLRASSFLLDILRKREDTWLAGAGCKEWGELFSLSLEDAVTYLSERLGSDPNKWTWGRLHSLTFSHPLAQNRPLSWLLNRGPYPIGGDMDTVHQGAFSFRQDFKASSWLPTYRQIVSLGNMEESVSIHAPGQSGHPASRHYSDLVGPWLRGEYHPMVMDRDAIMRNAEDVLVLEP